MVYIRFLDGRTPTLAYGITIGTFVNYMCKKQSKLDSKKQPATKQKIKQNLEKKN